MSDANGAAADAADAPPAGFEMGIAEYCVLKSRTDPRVELVNAFHTIEVRGVQPRDTQSGFERRFAAFASRPTA